MNFLYGDDDDDDDVVKMHGNPFLKATKAKGFTNASTAQNAITYPLRDDDKFSRHEMVVCVFVVITKVQPMQNISEDVNAPYRSVR